MRYPSRMSGMQRLIMMLAAIVTLSLCSCRNKGSDWKVSHGEYKSREWYAATLSSSTVRGIGQKATIALAFDGDSLSQATRSRDDITTPERCSVEIVLPCAVTAQEKWSGITIQVQFDNEVPRSIGWVWGGNSPENEVVLDGLTLGGNAGFIAAVERHQSLRLLVPCGAYDSSRVEFNIQGLEKSLISAGMKK